MMMLWAGGIGMVMAGISMCLADFQLLLMIGQSKSWVEPWKKLIEWGGMNRMLLTVVLAVAVLGLLAMQIYCLMAKSEGRKWWLAGVVLAALAAGSYPFLSKDIYTYLFSAKMVTDYGMNPYLTAPKVLLGKELWLDLMGSIERPYFYGPVYLGLSLVPLLILGTNRIISLILGFKFLNLVFWLIGGWLMERRTGDRKLTAAIWWFNPLLIVEWLVNGHNDLIMVVFFLMGNWWGWGLSFLSKWVGGGMALMLAIAGKKKRLAARGMVLAMFLYLIIRGGQPWYWTWAYMVLPWAEFRDKKSWIAIFVFQIIILAGYGEFIVTKKWGGGEWYRWLVGLAYLLPVLLWRGENKPAAIKIKEIIWAILRPETVQVSERKNSRKKRMRP